LELTAEHAREISWLLAHSVAIGSEQERADASYWRGALDQFATTAEAEAADVAAS
jgi:hypothetical protein